MESVSLSQASKLTKKSKSTLDAAIKKGILKAEKGNKGTWQINTDDLFALYPEKEQQKCERLESELGKLRNTISELEAKLKDVISEREKLELCIEEINNQLKIESDFPPTKINCYNESDPTNVFLRDHIDNIIKALEPFSASSYLNISPSICCRLVANYNYVYRKFQQDKQEYKNLCQRNDLNYKWENRAAYFERFVYSITDIYVAFFITTGTVHTSINQPNLWIQSNFKFD